MTNPADDHAGLISCRSGSLIHLPGFGGGSWADEVEETYGELPPYCCVSSYQHY
jgi:hypothetical protein